MEVQGWDFKRERLRKKMEEEIRGQHFSGALVGVYDKGEEVFFDAYGMADREKHKLMSRDTIFRLYSMSKPVAAVAAMILYERGELDFDAPVSQYLPEYAGMHVIGDTKEQTLSVRNLLNMTAGIVYPDEDGAGKAMSRLFGEIHARIRDGRGYSTREVARRIADVPLANEPGAVWRYGLCADVLGAVMEEITGRKLSEFYEKEIFGPLGMVDTGFYVPGEKHERLAQLYKQEVTGGEMHLEIERERTLGLTLCLEPPAFESAGAGLLSTLDDSARFCMMLANKGEWDGIRILRPETVGLFTQNQLDARQTKSIYFEHMKGLGYGNLMRVVIDEEASLIGGTEGEFGWDGWAGAYMYADCIHNRAMIYMVQVSAYSDWPLNKEIRGILGV